MGRTSRARDDVNILLIGLRCSGKTTIGGILAQRLRRAFVDLDDVTPGVLGAATVREAWDRFGQEAFRNAETVALSKVLVRDGLVVALGGGTPTAPTAADLIRDEREQGRALVIYLAASSQTLRARLAQEENLHRPTISGSDPVSEVEDVRAARDPLYRELADITIDVDAGAPQAIAETIARRIK